MPIDPVKIPQNVYIEDRIVGPLTLRQIIIIAVGGGFSYALYASLAKSYGGPPNIVVTVLVWLPALISAIVALVKINDLSIARICFLMLERVNKPAQRMYGPRRGLAIHIRTSAAISKQGSDQTPNPELATTQKKIEELSSVLDRGVTTMEVSPALLTAVKESEPAAAEISINDEVNATEPISLPVDPTRIKTDMPAGSMQLSDLSVFRDIFPQHD